MGWQIALMHRNCISGPGNGPGAKVDRGPRQEKFRNSRNFDDFGAPSEFSSPTAEGTNRSTVCSNCTTRKHMFQRPFWLFPAIRYAIRL